MVTATTLLKIAALTLIVSSQTTFGQAIQSQDIVLIWNVTDLWNSSSHIFRFNVTGLSQFYSCLCKEDIHDCKVARSLGNGEYTISNVPKFGSLEYEKAYECHLIRTSDDYGIYCARLLLGKDTMPSMCISYKYFYDVSTMCGEDGVKIMSKHVTNLDENVDDSLVQVKDCHTESTITIFPSSSPLSPAPQLPTSTLTLSKTSTLSHNTQAATPTVSTPNRTHSTNIHFVTKTTQSVTPSPTSQTVITSKISTAVVATTSGEKNTRLTEEEDDNDNLVTIILGVALGVVVIIATIIIIVVVFWRRRKGNPTSASSRKNHGTRTGDYETPYEMSDVSTNPAENSNSQAPVSVPGPNSYQYATVDLEKKHRNRKEKNSKKNSKGDHVYNNEKVLKTLGKKGQAKSGNATSHVADYCNLDPQQKEPKPAIGAGDVNKDIALVKSNELNDDEYSIVNKTSAYANATNNSNDSSSSSNNAKNTENSTDDEKNHLGLQNGGQCQDTGPEYSRLHETQRHFQNPYNILPDQVPVSNIKSTTQPVTDSPISSSFNITTDATSAYSMATPISK